MITITKVSPLTKKVNTRVIHISPEDLKTWEKDESNMKAISKLRPEEKEFLLTGATSEEWNEFYKVPIF